MLTGKYSRSDLDIGSGTPSAEGTRKNVAAANGALTERGLAIAEVVKEIAAELDTTPSRVALAWTLLNSVVTTSIVGVRTLAQLDDNLGALGVELDSKQQARLEDISAIDLGFPHEFLGRPLLRNTLLGEVRVAQRRPQ